MAVRWPRPRPAKRIAVVSSYKASHLPHGAVSENKASTPARRLPRGALGRRCGSGAVASGRAGQVGGAEVLVAVVLGPLGQAPADRAEKGRVDLVPLGRLLDEARILRRQREPE